MEMGATAAWVLPMTINIRSRHAATVNIPASSRALSASFHFASGPRDLLIADTLTHCRERRCHSFVSQCGRGSQVDYLGCRLDHFHLIDDVARIDQCSVP